MEISFKNRRSTFNDWNNRVHLLGLVESHRGEFDYAVQLLDVKIFTSHYQEVGNTSITLDIDSQKHAPHPFG